MLTQSPPSLTTPICVLSRAPTTYQSSMDHMLSQGGTELTTAYWNSSLEELANIYQLITVAQLVCVHCYPHPAFSSYQQIRQLHGMSPESRYGALLTSMQQDVYSQHLSWIPGVPVICSWRTIFSVGICPTTVSWAGL